MVDPALIQKAAQVQAEALKAGKKIDPKKYDLPLEYEVLFKWEVTAANKHGALQVAWSPRKPLESSDHRLRFTLTKDRFRKAYDEARAAFLQHVANELGGPVIVGDQHGVVLVTPNKEI